MMAFRQFKRSSNEMHSFFQESLECGEEKEEVEEEEDFQQPPLCLVMSLDGYTQWSTEL